MDTGYRPRLTAGAELRTEKTYENWIIDYLPLLLAGYFVVNFIVRLLLPDSLEFDESEQVLTAQWLSAGYGTQPPLYNWLQQLAFAIGGVSITTLAAFKNLMLFSIYLAYWYTARLIFKRNDFAAIATLGLMTIPQVVFESQRDLTHTVSVIFSASLFLLALFATLTKPSLKSYTALGLATGFGLLSKYNFAILPAATFFAIMFDGEGRKRLFDKRFLVSIIIAIGLVTPHLLWLSTNFEMASANTIAKMRGSTEASWFARSASGTLSMLLAVIGFAGITILAFFGLYSRTMMMSLSAQNRWTRLTENLLLSILLCLLVMIALVGAGNIKDRWLAPLLLILPLYFVMKLDASGRLNRLAWKRMFHLALVAMVLVPTILYLRVEAARWTGNYQKLNTPYHAAIDKILSETRLPSLVIADNTWIGGGIRLHLQEVPVYSPQFPQFQPQFSWTKERPIIAVWQTSEHPEAGIPPAIAGLVTRFAPTDSQMALRSFELPYNAGREGDTISFSYVVVTPAS